MTGREIFHQGPTDDKPTDVVTHVGYVAARENFRVVIANPSPRIKRELAHLGGELIGYEWILEVQNDIGVAALFDTLRNHGVLFGGAAHGWPPAELFELYREKGLLSGPYREVLFRGVGLGWSIYER